MSSLTTLRLQTGDDRSWYQPRYSLLPETLELTAGEEIAVRVALGNDGAVAWGATGRQAIALSYHWSDAATGRVIVYDGVRTPLPRELTPGDETIVTATVVAPPRPGRYVLQWDLVQEGFMWFSTRGAPTGDVSATVTPGTAVEVPPSSPPPVFPEPPREPTRLELWRAALQMWSASPIVGVGPDVFRHRYGPYLGRAQFDDRIHANSLYVETFATLGLLGSLALLGVIVTLALVVRRGWIAGGSDTRAVTAGAGIALAAFLIHGLVDYFFEFTSTYGLFWVVAGLAVVLASPRRRS